MRRILVLTIAIMLIGTYFPGRADAVDNEGPPCTDITDRGGTFYKVVPGPGPTGTALFHFEFFLRAPPCAFATYFLYVNDSSGATLRTATYPATAGNDALTLCDTNKFCYEQSFGTTPGAPTPIFVSGASMIQAHTADTTPTVDYVLCDANTPDTTYPDCPIGDNVWDQ